MTDFKKLKEVTGKDVKILTIRATEVYLEKTPVKTLFAVIKDDSEVLTNSSERKKHFEFSKNYSEWFKERLEEFNDPKTKKVRIANSEYPLELLTGDSYPILVMQEKLYFVQIYRDIYPKGWLMPGGCPKNMHEILNPKLTIDRELSEEVIVLDKDNTYYGLAINISDQEEQIQKNLKSWRLKPKATKKVLPVIIKPSYCTAERIDIAYRKTKARTNNVVVGIDCDVGSISVGTYLRYDLPIRLQDIRIFDGEKSGKTLLNRPVRLMKVQSMSTPAVSLAAIFSRGDNIFSAGYVTEEAEKRTSII